MSKRIVFATLGSLGDVHPYLAIGLELKRQGHDPVIAASEAYRAKIEATGVGFAPMRPHLSKDDRQLVELVMDERRGSEVLLRDTVMPVIRDSYADLEAAVRGADLLVSHPATYAAPVLGERTGIPWVSSVLAPISFFSYLDPPVPPPALWLRKFRWLGPLFFRPLLAMAKRVTEPWAKPVAELRAELGLPPGKNPIWDGQHSPARVLALFSRALAEPQADWPANTVVTGFAFYDQLVHGKRMDAELSRFLDAGEPPVVFTLGSAAVLAAGDFYRHSLEAVKRLGCRAVFLYGDDRDNLPAEPLPAGVAAFDYAPYSELFPRAAAVVHQGGVGTTSQVMRAGKPMLVIPFGHDQQDNGSRIERAGAGRVLSRKRYRGDAAFRHLVEVLAGSAYRESAAAIGKRVRSEDGAMAAAADLTKRR